MCGVVMVVIVILERVPGYDEGTVQRLRKREQPVTE